MRWNNVWSEDRMHYICTAPWVGFLECVSLYCAYMSVYPRNPESLRAETKMPILSSSHDRMSGHTGAQYLSNESE